MVAVGLEDVQLIQNTGGEHLSAIARERITGLTVPSISVSAPTAQISTSALTER